jgi:hypothetical protein
VNFKQNAVPGVDDKLPTYFVAIADHHAGKVGFQHAKPIFVDLAMDADPFRVTSQVVLRGIFDVNKGFTLRLIYLVDPVVDGLDLVAKLPGRIKLGNYEFKVRIAIVGGRATIRFMHFAFDAMR